MLETAKVPPAFEAVKDNDEVIYWSGKPEFIPFILRGVPFLVVGFLAEMLYKGRHIQGLPLFMDAGTLVFLASALYMVYLFLVYGNTAYAVSSKRLMMRSGFFGIDFKAVDYDKISDIEVNVLAGQGVGQGGDVGTAEVVGQPFVQLTAAVGDFRLVGQRD
ncbi:MAG: PH domain-containing protein, partial [candidate division Zixibacteria bacterium]|nr:PH domain-containing protein [candidate division Zixibacteria bacterium]